MLPSLVQALGVVVIIAPAMAQNFWTTQSEPFYLTVISTNTTLNGTVLDACHEGAAIEGLCTGGSLNNVSEVSNTYKFNTTANSDPSESGIPGILNWDLHYGGNTSAIAPSAMSLFFSPTSNVAAPIFMPGDDRYQMVQFDDNDNLVINGFIDDSVFPFTYNSTSYDNWYVCVTYYGYQYSTLAWRAGTYPPQNPTCQKVSVKRVWVAS